MNRNRQDVHRPAEMIPSDYRYLASSYPYPAFDPVSGKEYTEIEWDGTAEWDALGQPDRSTCAHAVTGQCDHCGAHHSYQTILLYIPTGEILSVGHTCAATRFDRPEWKNQIASGKRRAELKAERNRKIAAALAEMTPETRAAYDWAVTEENAHYIAKDIASKVPQYGPLSVKQSEFLVKLFTESQEKAQAVADKEIVPCPEGRITITGQIKSIKSIDTMFGSTIKMLVEAAEGYRVYGTMPLSLCAHKGDFVKFTATVEAKKDDVTFGFFSRPSKAIRVDEAGNPAPLPTLGVQFTSSEAYEVAYQKYHDEIEAIA